MRSDHHILNVFPLDIKLGLGSLQISFNKMGSGLHYLPLGTGPNTHHHLGSGMHVLTPKIGIEEIDVYIPRL
jgi:hypothetical protein